MQTPNADPTAWHDATEAHTAPGAAGQGETYTLRLRTRLRPTRVDLLELRHGEILAFDAQRCESPYTLLETGAAEQWYSIQLRLLEPRTRYVWRLQLEGDTLHLSTAGLSRLCPGYRDWYSVLAGYRPPRWVWESVFYQIFPDRFRRGSSGPRLKAGDFSYPNLHPDVVQALAPGGELERAALGAFPVRTPDWDEPLSIAEDMHTRYGGDLEGIQEALPYLEALGVNALWLNPIFTSPSSHRYDVTDYLSIDPHLGGEAAFRSLSASLHTCGIRLVLDGVFNHVGNEHALFQAALAGPLSPERGYFTFRNQPAAGVLPYHGFYNVPTQPKLNYADERTYDVFIDGPDSVVRHWLREGADGWRLDVAQGMGGDGTDAGNQQIMRRLKRAAREENRDAYVVGERFFDAEHALVDGEGEDGVMNYHAFTFPVMAWFSGHDHNGAPLPVDTEELVAHLWDGYRVLPPPLALNQFNLLESHDIPRALYRLNEDTGLYLAALTLMMAYPGTPCLYYGGEIGLSQSQGDAMSYSRATFPWDASAWNHPLLASIQRLVAQRRSLPALQRGSLRFAAVGQDCFAVLRELAEGGVLSRVLCLVSRSSVPVTLSVDLPAGRWRDLESRETVDSRAGSEGGLTHLTWQGARLLCWEVATPDLKSTLHNDMGVFTIYEEESS